jgi:hypothetical protein
MEEKKEFKIPDHVINTYIDKYDIYPSITQTRNVIQDAIDLLTKKNKKLWFESIYDGEKTFLKKVLIDYSTTYKIMIYVSSIDNEKVYKLFVFSDSEETNNVGLLLKGLNKYYTIDKI